jgi:LPS-assembly protein
MRFRFFLLLLPILFVFSHASQAQDTVQPQKPVRPVKKAVVSKEAAPTVITADSVEAKQGQILEAKGNAEIRKEDQFVRADHLLFLQESNEVFADGDVRVEKSDTTMTGPSLKMNMDKNTGEMVQPKFFLTEPNVHGSAELLRMEGKQIYSFDKASYTSCPVGKDDWLLKMGELELDRNTQIGTAYNARIEFMGVPFLYTPWMNFPLNDQRRSGLLGPILGNTNKDGREFTTPFYWNISSNYDATISPRFIEKRGILLDNEFRYMGNSYSGKLDYGELKGDNIAQRDRSHTSLVHVQNLGAGFAGSLNLNEASDNAYFRDLSSNPAIALQNQLLQEVALTYGGGGWWNTSVRAQRFQTLQADQPLDTPYRRLPQVNLGAQRVIGGVNATLNAEYTNFDNPSFIALTGPLAGTQLVNGSRSVLYPNVTYPLVNDPAYYITPKLGMHISQYSLTEKNPNPESTYSRSVPIFSLDSSMTLEREFMAFEGEYLQTLEPRIFYVHIPFVAQDNLPVFDSAQPAFSFMQMFTENRFIGNDRIGDANQVTTALTSRLLDADNGNELLRVTMGERFSSQTPRVFLGGPTATTNASDVLLSVAGRMSKALSLDSLMQYNPNESRTEMFVATARYRPEAGKVFNLGYRYTFSADPDPIKTLKQVDFSMQWPFLGRWHTVAQMQYSLQTERAVQSMAGLEYYQDCWAFRLGVQQFVTTLRETSTTIFVQLELNELIRVGDDTLSSLRQSVPGYTPLNESARKKRTQSTP